MQRSLLNKFTGLFLFTTTWDLSPAIEARGLSQYLSSRGLSLSLSLAVTSLVAVLLAWFMEHKTFIIYVLSLLVAAVALKCV